MKHAALLVVSLSITASASALTPYLSPPSTILPPYPAPGVVEGRPLVSTLDIHGQLVVGWVEQQGGRDHVLVSAVTADGTVDRQHPADLTETVGTPFQTASAPALAYDGQEVLAAFTAATGKSVTLYTTRLDRNLYSLDSQPVTLAVADDATPLLPPTATWNGNDFLVAWGSMVTAVHSNGSPAGTLLLAANGVTWTRVVSAGAGQQTRFVSVDYTAPVPAHCGFSPAFCSKGSPARSFLRALTLDEHGVFNSYSSIDVGALTSLGSLALATSGSGSLAVLMRDGALQSMKLDARGNVDQPRLITTLAPGRRGLATVAAGGNEWLAVYEDVPLGEQEPTLFGAFLDADGKLVAPPVRLTAGAALSPSLIGFRNGVYRLTFARPTGTTMDVETMVISSHPQGRTRTSR